MNCMFTAIRPLAPRDLDAEWGISGWDDRYYRDWVADPDAVECLEALTASHVALERLVDVPLRWVARPRWSYLEYWVRDFTDFLLIERAHDGAQALLIEGTPEAAELRREPYKEWGDAIEAWVDFPRQC